LNPKAGTDVNPDTLRLRPAPSFVQAFTLDGRPYIAKDSEPYVQYWLTERDRLLLALFAVRGGATAADAVARYLKLAEADAGPAGRRRVARAIADMRAAGVLIGPDDDSSRYTARIVDDYVAHRPFPQPLSDHIAHAAEIGAATRVLDLAGGPGDLALALARHSGAVSLMELSKGFLAAARRRARQEGLALQTLHDSCNRLVHRDERYDVVTVSQALHWLDDVMVCRGLCRVLAAAGSFFVVHSAIELDDAHPLAHVLGHDSILGRKQRQSFVAEVRPLQRRLQLLFEALDAPDVQRIDPTQALLRPGVAGLARIAAAGTRLFRQRRPFGVGYARGFLTPQHIAVTGQSTAAFWRDLDARCAAATPQQLMGTHHWAVLHFRRGADGAVVLDEGTACTEIAFEGTAPA
jgi:SAM-dependent methyltransferase